MSDSHPEGNKDVQPAVKKLVPPRDIVTGGFSKHADLISYVVTGLGLGLLLDWALNTRPIMVILWTLAGLAVGYRRLWQASANLEEEGRERSHGA